MPDAATRPLRSSESIGIIAAALAKAQAAFLPVHKDRTAEIQTKTGGRYTYSYVDLASIQDAIRGPLTANELAITQALAIHDHRVTVETTLLHASGEWLASELTLQILDAHDPRSVGSAITYGRRFGLTALVGVAAGDDDDAEAATKATEPAKRPRTPLPPADRPRATDQPQPIPPDPPRRRQDSGSKPITDAMKKKFFATARDCGWTDVAPLKATIYQAFGVSSTNDLRVDDFDQAMELVKRGPRPIPPVPEVP